MRKGLLWVLGVLALGSGSLAAQQTLPLADTKTADEGSGPGTLPAATPGAPEIPIRSDTGDGFRWWARSEYLLWWVKGAPVPQPLVTTGDPKVGFAAGINSAGAIGQPGTQVLFGNSTVDFQGFSGMKAVIGGWLDRENTYGFEGGGFLLEKRTSQFSASSDAAGNPPLYFPFFSVTANGGAGAERAAPIADPLRGFSGSVTVTSSLQMWGTEFNGLLNLLRRPGLEVNLIGGFRYVDLAENLDTRNPTDSLFSNNLQVLNDHFGTRNQFYGGQMGTRLSWELGRLGVDLTGMVALGANHEIVDIQGHTSQVALPGGFAPIPGPILGGIYTQRSNIGNYSANQFSVLPTLELKVSYQLSPRIRAFAGYDFMYWNQVVRPGNQIDHNVNILQNSITSFPFPLSGPLAPLPQFNRTDFWAHGVSFGVEVRF